SPMPLVNHRVLVGTGSPSTMTSKFFSGAMLLMSFAGSLPAQTVVQSESFSDSGSTNTPGNDQVLISSTFLDVIFQLFYSSLGTLDSFTLAWTVDVTWDYVVGAGATTT